MEGVRLKTRVDWVGKVGVVGRQRRKVELGERFW